MCICAIVPLIFYEMLCNFSLNLMNTMNLKQMSGRCHFLAAFTTRCLLTCGQFLSFSVSKLNSVPAFYSPILFFFLFAFIPPILPSPFLFSLQSFFSPDPSCTFLITDFPSVWQNPPLWSNHDQDTCTHWVGIHRGTVSPAWRLLWDNYTEICSGCVIRQCHRVLCVCLCERVCMRLIWCLCMWESEACIFCVFLC